MTLIALPSTSARLTGLDALRGVAALAVVLMHTHALFPSFPDYAPKAYLAVDFFFVLSGFVMARTYEHRLAKGYGAGRFFAARYHRLWPTMLLGALLFLPFLNEATHDPDWHWQSQVLPNLLLLPSLSSDNLFPLNVPAWSIFFELVANLIHGLVLWRLRLRWIAAIALLSLIGIVQAAMTLGNFDIGSAHGQLLAGLFRVGVTYCMGIALWRVWGERRLHGYIGLLALLALPLAFTVSDNALHGWIYDLGFVLLACPLLMLGALAISRGTGLAKISGDLSFPLYAVHYPILYWCRSYELGPWESVLVCALIAALVAGVQNGWQITSRNRSSTI